MAGCVPDTSGWRFVFGAARVIWAGLGYGPVFGRGERSCMIIEVLLLYAGTKLPITINEKT